jgi:glycosyltransferase involved in cell wall biosynthesis
MWGWIKMKSQNKKIKCIIFGSITKLKGYERAIAVIEKNSNISLTIAGPLWNPLEKLTADYLKKKEKELKNLKIEIRELGEDEFEEYAKKSDIILFPYWKEVPASGIFARLLRYFKPMIAWRNHEFIDYEKNFGACITVGSVKELGEKILQVYKSKKIKKELKQGAKRLMKERSWENSAKQHITVYKSL